MIKLAEDLQVPFLRKLVEACVHAIVEFPERVKISTDVMPARVVFSVFVARDDMGLVLGADGATADAIRRVLWTAAKKTEKRVDLDFLTDGR